ncbi:MAG: DUF4192 family protein, partial [Propionibacteriaceae bacterium]|nr:DUF4192 family protein [Propionibacteriaceae bacterium]
MDKWQIRVGVAKTEDMTVKLTSVDALLAAVPQLLGFHPKDSVVAVVSVDKIIKVSARAPIAWLRTGEQIRACFSPVISTYPGAVVHFIAFSARDCRRLLRRIYLVFGDAVGELVWFDGQGYECWGGYRALRREEVTIPGGLQVYGSREERAEEVFAPLPLETVDRQQAAQYLASIPVWERADRALSMLTADPGIGITDVVLARLLCFEEVLRAAAD